MFKNYVPFTMCIIIIGETTTYHVEDLGLIMLMWNLVKYSLNHSDTTGSLWICFKVE